MKKIIAFLVIIYLILLIFFIRSFDKILNHIEMKIYISWGIIAIFISFYIFYEYNRVKKAKKNERRDELNNRRKELLNNILKSKKKNSNPHND